MGLLYLEDHDCHLAWHDLPGQGVPLVCLPALGLAAAPNFLTMACDPALAQTRRILIDLPGSGLSEPARDVDQTPRAYADLVARLLDHLDPGPSVIFGHSLGGSVAIALAMARQDLVTHLVVAEGNLTPGGGAGARAIAQEAAESYVARGHAEQLRALRARAARGSVTGGALFASWRLADPASLHGAARGLVDLDPGLETAFLGLDCPRSFVYGARSLARNLGAPDVPDPERLRAAGIATEVIGEAGHFMPLDNPSDTARLLARILAEG